MEYINICNNSSRFENKSNSISSKNSLFKEDIIVKYDENEKKITFTLATIDYTGKTKKATVAGSGWYSLFINEDLPRGRHFVDEEESNEDQLVVYFD